MVSIIAAGLLIGLILFLVSRNPSPDTVRQGYLYVVSFAALITMIVGVVRVADGVFGLIYPPPPVETTIPAAPIERTFPDGRPLPEPAKTDPEAQAKRERYNQVRQIAENTIMSLTVLPVFLYHQRKIKKNQPGL